MITGVIYSESGGTTKTTTTANLGVASARMGLDTLVIDLDPQEANLTHLFGAGEHRHDEEADNLASHILEMGEGDFYDLIKSTKEGVDIIPAHDMLENFTSNLEQKINYETGVKNIDRSDYPRYQLLYDLLWEEEELHTEYDAVFIDPNARAEDLLFNAIYAMRTLIAPVQPAGKGSLSLDGLEAMADNLSDELSIEVGLSCVVPTQVGQTNAHQGYREHYESDEDLSTPVAIGDRQSMMDAMWEAQGSAFKVIEERWKTFEEDGEMKSESGARGIRDRELETLRKYYELAWFVATETFDNPNVDPVLTLDIDSADSRTFDVSGGDTKEALEQ
jgi:cellulose biosynthesis protein BcsQ